MKNSYLVHFQVSTFTMFSTCNRNQYLVANCQIMFLKVCEQIEVVFFEDFKFDLRQDFKFEAMNWDFSLRFLPLSFKLLVQKVVILSKWFDLRSDQDCCQRIYVPAVKLHNLSSIQLCMLIADLSVNSIPCFNNSNINNNFYSVVTWQKAIARALNLFRTHRL